MKADAADHATDDDPPVDEPLTPEEEIILIHLQSLQQQNAQAK